MKVTRRVAKILSYYESDNPGVKCNIARILTSGKLSGTGKMLILAVDQGFEHGPAQSFACNPAAYDPHYHFQLAVDGGVNAFAAPLGLIESGAVSYAAALPLILKMNSSNSLIPKNSSPNQAITASIADALRLGCSAIGFTIYPGSSKNFEMIEQYRELASEAKTRGLAVVVWAYVRGEDIDKEDEAAIDMISYAAHMSSLLGAHIIKLKLPSARVAIQHKPYESIEISTLKARVHDVVRSANRRLVIFSGGQSRATEELYQQTEAIRDGGGHGTIMGRNLFQRKRSEALSLLGTMINLYKGKLL